MKITLISLFPDLLATYLNTSILGRAVTKGLVEYQLINLRDYGEGVHQVVDGRPYGGGAGMVFRADILQKALIAAGWEKSDRIQVVLTSASGLPYNQATARSFANLEHLIIICGHYEGVDQRFIDRYVDMEISIGDFVLTGGELPALMIADSVVRLIPGVLKKEEATVEESFSENLLEYPHYTRPQQFEGADVPEILISGDHGKVATWRKEKSVEKTKKNRPDLIS